MYVTNIKWKRGNSTDIYDETLILFIFQEIGQGRFSEYFLLKTFQKHYNMPVCQVRMFEFEKLSAYARHIINQNLPEIHHQYHHYATQPLQPVPELSFLPSMLPSFESSFLLLQLPTFFKDLTINKLKVHGNIQKQKWNHTCQPLVMNNYMSTVVISHVYNCASLSFLSSYHYMTFILHYTMTTKCLKTFKYIWEQGVEACLLYDFWALTNWLMFLGTWYRTKVSCSIPPTCKLYLYHLYFLAHVPARPRPCFT